MELDAIILAGGRASRLGGIAKPQLSVGGRRLIDIALDAAEVVGVRRPIIVGPAGMTDRALVVREDPMFSGPVAALAAALPHARGEWVLLLASDLPHAVSAVRRLRASATDNSTTDGYTAVDPEGRMQWLLGLYRRASLERGIASLTETSSVSGASLRQLLGGLALTSVAMERDHTLDVDTWEDVQSARNEAKGMRMSDDIGDQSPVASTPDELVAWIDAASARLGLRSGDVPITLILDLARDVAHGVARPAAPLTTFLVGLAAARDDHSAYGIARVADDVRALLNEYLGTTP